MSKLEAQLSKQQGLIAELHAEARRTAEQRDAAAARLKERLAQADAELARARLANSKLKSDFLEQTALLGAAGGLAAATGAPPPLSRTALEALTGALAVLYRPSGMLLRVSGLRLRTLLRHSECCLGTQTACMP